MLSIACLVMLVDHVAHAEDDRFKLIRKIFVFYFYLSLIDALERSFDFLNGITVWFSFFKLQFFILKARGTITYYLPFFIIFYLYGC